MDPIPPLCQESWNPWAGRRGDRDRLDEGMRLSDGEMPDGASSASVSSGEGLEEHIDWRAKHPSDDLMTELLNAE